MIDPKGRVDVLLLGAAEVFCKEHLQPLMAVPLDLWDDLGVRQLMGHAINRLRVPHEPITEVQFGQLRIPVSMIEKFARACLGSGETKRVPGGRL